MKKSNKFREELKVKIDKEKDEANEKTLKRIDKYNIARIIKKNPERKKDLMVIFESEKELEEYFSMIDEYDSKNDIEK